MRIGVNIGTPGGSASYWIAAPAFGDTTIVIDSNTDITIYTDYGQVNPPTI